MEDKSELKELFGYEKKASRLELFVRIFYAIPVAIVLMVYGFVASICLCVQWIIILILGQRNESLNGVIAGFLKYNVHLYNYFNYITDERPGVMPKNVKIYEVEEE
jgi:hypothetical protein